MEVETASFETVLHSPDPSLQESLEHEAVPDPLAGEQTWPTEEEMKSAAKGKKKVLKRMVKGMSEYQACWIPEDDEDAPQVVAELSDQDEDDDNHDMQDAAPQARDHEEHDGMRDDGDDEAGEGSAGHDEKDDESGNSDTEMDGEDLKAEEERRRAKDEERRKRAEEGDFPDETEVPVDHMARVRFVKYRGLKSMRTSTWDAKENLPLEYGRIFHFENFKRAQKRVLSRSNDGVAVGTYVTVHLRAFPASLADSCDVDRRLIVAGCLLQHENKTSVLHFAVQKHPSFSATVVNKEEVEIQCGLRRFSGRMLLSEHTANVDKHKMERVLHPSRFTVASTYGPITFPPAPVLFFKRDETGERRLVATGSLLSVDPDRIILKRIVLTGYPFKIHKKRCVVRFMFRTAEDVRWFKPVQLWTKLGRTGHIRETLGTHGYMKCLFDAMVQPNDTVCMSLYKRVFPPWSPSKF